MNFWRARANSLALVLTAFTKRPDWHYDITKSLEGVARTSKPSVSISDGQLLSFISASFLFRNEQGRAGQSVRGQLSIKSNAHPGSAPIVLSSLHINFSGSVESIVLRHQEPEQETPQRRGNTTLSAVALTKQPSDDAETDPAAPDDAAGGVLLHGSADLTLPPGQTLVFNMEIPLREPGETRADSLAVNMESEEFALRQSLIFRESTNTNLWYISASAAKHVAHPHPLVVRVLPRPPKMEVKCPAWKGEYYTDEPVSLEFEIENGEDVEAHSKLDVLLFGEKPPDFTVDIPGRERQTSSSARTEESRLSGAQLGVIASTKTLTVRLGLPPIGISSRYDLTLKITYFLPTNPGTPISQTAVFQLNIVNPFEATYEFLARVHPDPWPSVFDHETVAALPAGDGEDADESAKAHVPPKGISQAWCLLTRYASFASEPLRIIDVDMHVQPSPAFHCTFAKETNLPASGTGKIVNPKTIEHVTLNLEAQRATVDDRSHAALDVSLMIKWTRPDADPTATNTSINTTTVPLPRFTIFGTEPRVLASVSYHHARHEDDLPSITLTLTIENASSHFLTFGVSMEPSGEFAFSGPKQTTLNLLPVSRRAVDFRLLPLRHAPVDPAVHGPRGYWVRPALVVRDKYFQKVLRIIPASAGLSSGKDGLEIWVPGYTRRGSADGAGE